VKSAIELVGFYLPLLRSQRQPSVPRNIIQIQSLLSGSNGLKIYSTNKGTHNTQTQNAKSQNQQVQWPISRNVVSQLTVYMAIDLDSASYRQLMNSLGAEIGEVLHQTEVFMVYE
jgi:hypothetical protein